MKKIFFKKLIYKIFEKVGLKKASVRRNQGILVIKKNKFRKLLLKKI